ncbi:MAG: plastocyanin/azurin family copper-binding protein, partial [Mycobacteriales bacterium]
VEHSATGDDKSFDSKTFGKGKSYSYTFTKAGTYEYHCTPHGYMKGKVIVT